MGTDNTDYDPKNHFGSEESIILPGDNLIPVSGEGTMGAYNPRAAAFTKAGTPASATTAPAPAQQTASAQPAPQQGQIGAGNPETDLPDGWEHGPNFT